MKIAILTTSFPRFEGDFAGHFILEYARQLCRLDCAVEAVAPHDPLASCDGTRGGIKTGFFKYFFPAKWQILAYGGGMADRIKRNRLALLQTPFFLGAFFAAAWRAARRSDLLHAHWAVSALIAVAVKSVTGIPIVVTLWGSDILLLNRPLISGALKFALNRADAVVCESRQFKDRLTGLGVADRKISMIPNGVDLERFKALDKLSARNALALPSGKTIVLTAGRLVPVKGQRYLLEALAEIVRSAENVVCVLVGEGESRAELEALTKTLGLERHVVFAGLKSREEMPLWLNAADIFALPSVSEGNPNVSLEALACGLPVVASRVGGVPEMIRDGVNGRLVPPMNAPALASALLALIQDDGLRERLGGNARKFSEENRWTWEDQARALKAVYESAIRNR